MLDDKIWARVDRSGGPDACWIWMGGKIRGYGRININGRPTYVHRASLAEHLGRSLLPGMEACHHCDNPACVNPTHLWEGTRTQNHADMVAKDRHQRGTRHERVKVSPTDVIACRYVAQMFGIGHRPLAKALGVCHTTIGRAIAGVTWKSADSQEQTEP